jgi:DNA phosphorothioation-associated putative methyltransferase
MSLAHLTAISRKNPSAPMKWLVGEFAFASTDAILDYGCGRGCDVTWMKNHDFNITGYDPYYSPNTIQNGMKECFDIITCNFVLNVIDSSHGREGVIHHIKGLLKPLGVAYIAIRADKKKLNGYTKRGTYQTYVDILPAHGFKLINKTGSYELYEFTKETSNA